MRPTPAPNQRGLNTILALRLRKIPRKTSSAPQSSIGCLIRTIRSNEQGTDEFPRRQVGVHATRSFSQFRKLERVLVLSHLCPLQIPTGSVVVAGEGRSLST